MKILNNETETKEKTNKAMPSILNFPRFLGSTVVVISVSFFMIVAELGKCAKVDRTCLQINTLRTG